jgi:glutathionylspermidine amidase/synthetase
MTEFRGSYFQFLPFDVPSDHYSRTDWVDISLGKPFEMFVAKYGAHPLDDPEQKSSKYFSMPASVHAEVVKATNELHIMFTQATEYVLKNPQYWRNFGIPDEFWPLAVRSFERGDKILSGRFDLALSPEYGIKCYEYNADSASCLIECTYSQDAWSKAMELNVGVGGGIGAVKRIVSAWSKALPVGSIVHFFYDENDGEESIHAAYCMYLSSQAGLIPKEASSLVGYTFDDDGHPRDADGQRIEHTWKSWNYTTLLIQLEDAGPIRSTGEVRLIDIFFNENISVLEPLWSAIPSNKAILPVLTELFPDSPYLLYSTFHLTDEMRLRGYCAKPVLGRGGQNVSLHYGSSAEAIALLSDDPYRKSAPGDSVDTDTTIEREGRFSYSPTVYQFLATLPRTDGMYVQVNTFTGAGLYAGTVMRTEQSAIVGYNSAVYALRIVDDGSGTPLPGSDA